MAEGQLLLGVCDGGRSQEDSGLTTCGTLKAFFSSVCSNHFLCPHSYSLSHCQERGVCGTSPVLISTLRSVPRINSTCLSFYQ